MYQRINHLASDRNRPHSVETGCGHPPLKSHISNPLASPPKKGDDQYWEWVGWQSRCWKLKLPSCGVANPDSATVTALQPGLCSYRHSSGNQPVCCFSQHTELVSKNISITKYSKAN